MLVRRRDLDAEFGEALARPELSLARDGESHRVEVVGVAAFFDTPITALPQIKAGTVRALGITSSKRLPNAPEIPTIAEAGLPGYEVTGWNGLLAPANTPRPIIDKLNKAVVSSLQTPEVQKLLAEQGLEPAGNSPEEFASVMHADIEKWIRVTREAGIEPQ